MVVKQIFEKKDSYSFGGITPSFRRREFRVQIPGMLEEEALNGHIDFATYSSFQDFPDLSLILPRVALAPHVRLLKLRPHSSIMRLLMTDSSA